jgi:hypothetical protein
MAARLLLAMPPERKRQWTSDSINPNVRDAIADVYVKLSQLNFGPDGQPIDLPLTADAEALFVDFVNEHGEEQQALDDDDMEAAWAKLEGYAARLALVIHLVRVVTGDDAIEDPDKADATSIATGINLARWFGEETRRVYASMSLSDEDRFRQRLVEKIRSNAGGRITPRDLQRSSRRFPTTADATAALDELVGLRLGDWDHSAPGSSGGRPSTPFVLFPLGADVDKTPDSEPPQGVLSAQGGKKRGSVDTRNYEREERLAIEQEASS